MPRSFNIALTGFMGVGKSVVGRSLARRLKRPFVDLDRAIEKAEGMKVAEIFAQKGEPYFRAVEKRTLAETLWRDGQVIATGGGVVLDEDNLRLLNERSLFICLTASADVIYRRVCRAKQRPLLKGFDMRKRIEDLLQERQQNYARAQAVIDTSELSVNQVVDRIVELVHAGN